MARARSELDGVGEKVADDPQQARGIAEDDADLASDARQDRVAADQLPLSGGNHPSVAFCDVRRSDFLMVQEPGWAQVDGDDIGRWAQRVAAHSVSRTPCPEMKIRIRERDTVMTPKLRAHVLRRLGFALSRFGEKVVSVIVRISKSNGHPGGIDTRCQIDVGLARSVKATATHSDALLAVDRAAANAGRSVARALERERDMEQRPCRPLGTKKVRSRA
ncbi:MAG: HPF/RaiA family ribosome-associated protein [Polyangiaceae bacterium]|nr:HPF/RaiA family ribosome-associated protein [Polyangiaceae bacterium]